MVEKVNVENNNITLEAEYYAGSPNNQISVLLCHPHPMYGGTMHNNVVSGVFNALKKQHIPCLRFNFRGIGHSTGIYSGGSGELEDVSSCVDYLVNEKDQESVLICGYSYGAAIGCSVVEYSDEIIGFIAISFPWDFMGKDYKSLSQTSKPKLFIQGTRDTIANFSSFNNHYDTYEEPKDKVIIEGADHFYRGYESQVGSEVIEFYREIK